MSHRMQRRSFLLTLSAAAGAGFFASPLGAAEPPAESPGADFPRTDDALVGQFVGLSHGNLAEVTRLVEHQPSLARASWDWGFGDWETGLGAASHTGQREIAEILLAHGAHPTVFSATMLGQLDVVKAFVAASPGVQRTPGPHGITLLAHARAGGTTAEPVLKYLESLGDADTRAKLAPLEAADRDRLVGRYTFGSGDRDAFDVDIKNDQLGILRGGGSRRMLFHTGDLVFFPSGVPSVRIAFARDGQRVTQLTIADPDVFLTARRQA